MELPLLNRPPPAPQPAAKQLKRLPRRILLVDDQPPVRDAIRLLLEFDQYAVVEAANGVEALALFKPSHFDLIITDFEMPGMGGDRLARCIKEVSPSQPILMITAYTERLGDADKAVDAVLIKPFPLEELRQTMAQLLR